MPGSEAKVAMNIEVISRSNCYPFLAQCTTSCGVGKQTRQVTCRASSPEGWILDGFIADRCNDMQRPINTQQCNLGDCDSHFRWRAGDWQNVSNGCFVLYRS